MIDGIDSFVCIVGKQRLCEEHPHHLSHHRSSYQKAVEYFFLNHGEVTHQTSKNYQIYDEQQQAVGILSALSSLVVAFLCFRRTCLKTMLAGPNSKSGNSPHGLSVEELNHLLMDCEQSVMSLLGDKLQSQSLLERSDKISLAEEESQMCELLGIPVPCSCCCVFGGAGTASGPGTSNAGRCAPGTCGLIAAQCRVEAALHNTQQYLRYENSILYNEEVQPEESSKAHLASSQALKDMQREIHSSLWGDNKDTSGATTYGGSDKINRLKSLRTTGGGSDHPETLDDSPDSPTTHNKTVLHVSDLQVVAEANVLMHQQRVEQTTRYLEYLNGKAARKKKILFALVNLWKSTKIALGHKNALTSLSATQEMKEQLRLFAMPVEDIVVQTRQVQKVLIDDMQKETNTKTSQVCIVDKLVVPNT